MGLESVDAITASLLFSVGIAIGIVLDHWVLPALVDVWVGRLRRRRHGR